MKKRIIIFSFLIISCCYSCEEPKEKSNNSAHDIAQNTSTNPGLLSRIKDMSFLNTVDEKGRSPLANLLLEPDFLQKYETKDPYTRSLYYVLVEHGAIPICATEEDNMKLSKIRNELLRINNQYINKSRL